jgi:DNA-directed RNA polymerase specialized sigma24 family protein
VETRTIAAAASGDADALAAVVDDFMPTVLGAAFGLTGDWHDAGDVAQEVFATMVVRLGDLRDPAALPGWLMAVTRNAARRRRGLDLRVAHATAQPPTSDSEDEAIVATMLVVSGSRSRRCRHTNAFRSSCTTSRAIPSLTSPSSVTCRSAPSRSGCALRALVYEKGLTT